LHKNGRVFLCNVTGRAGRFITLKQGSITTVLPF
jgi:hypothetical protein